MVVEVLEECRQLPSRLYLYVADPSSSIPLSRAGVRDFESADRLRAHDGEPSIRVALQSQLRTDECARIAETRARAVEGCTCYHA
jgi:hypothetical protein